MPQLINMKRIVEFYTEHSARVKTPGYLPSQPTSTHNVYIRVGVLRTPHTSGLLESPTLAYRLVELVAAERLAMATRWSE